MGRLESGRRCPARDTIRDDVAGCKLNTWLTKDLRYDSNDSREIEKGSFSLSMLRWLEDMVDVGDLCQKLFFSGGEGYCIDERHCKNRVRSISLGQLTGR